MKKLIKSIFIVFILFSQISPVVAAQSPVNLYSQYAYLYDPETTLVYIDQKSDEKIYPASMTKILTVSLALEKIQNLKETIVITKQDYNGVIEEGATTAGFAIGEKVTYEDLLYGALLPSGAEACQALARLTYGSIEKFVEAMNEKVKALELQNTHFMNVTGLHHEHHYTTTHEMALILNHALNNKEFVKVFEARKYKSSNGKHNWISSLQRGKDYKNIDISHIDGGKSGYTDEAQLTFASTMTIDNHQLILVTAKAEGIYTQNHVRDVVSVYQYMNEHFHQVVFYQENEAIKSYWLLKSLQLQYTLKAKQPISILVEKSINNNNIEKEIVDHMFLFAPLKKGDSLGKMTIRYQGNAIYEYPLVVLENIESPLLAQVLYYAVTIGVPVALIGIFSIKIYKRKRS